MPVTLVERTRQLIAAEDDDFFQADTIKYYINKSQEKVVAYLIQSERANPIRSLRGLDLLRKSTSVQVGTPSPSQKRNYWLAYTNVPVDLSQYLYLRYNDRTVLRELTSQNLHKLQWSNLIPTPYESYFYIANVGGSVKFQLYLFENPAAKNIEVYYVEKPTPIELEDETFADIPPQLENAILYGAAIMMLTQEQKDPNQINLIEGKYTQELQINGY